MGGSIVAENDLNRPQIALMCAGEFFGMKGAGRETGREFPGRFVVVLRNTGSLDFARDDRG
jgi:hypothetical protein